MNETILFVDDDIKVVSALQRSLYKNYRIEIAGSPKDGLDAIAETPYAVVVSDLEMPGMNGIQFLTRVKQVAPQTIRILLTGQADLDTAIAAVNDGNIFRFLTKPCRQELLTNTLDAALEQYRLICGEREVLQGTLIGTAGVLVEILGVTHPVAFGRTVRIQAIVRHLARELNLVHLWEIEAAAVLSQIGCIAVAPDVLRKYFAGQPLSGEESREFRAHPAVGRKLLKRVPRLSTVGEIIERQMQAFAIAPALEPKALTIAVGAQALRVAIDFERLRGIGFTAEAAVAEMRGNASEYNPQMLDALDRVKELGGPSGSPAEDTQDPALMPVGHFVFTPGLSRLPRTVE